MGVVHVSAAAEAVLLRSAAVEDAPALAPLVSQLGYPAGAEAVAGRIERMLEHPDYRVLVAEAEGRAVGVMGLLRGWSLTFDRPYVRVTALVVAEEARGRGVGARLMEEAEAWARVVGAGSVHLTTGSHREGAHGFYRRLGYEGTGMRFHKRLG